MGSVSTEVRDMTSSAQPTVRQRSSAMRTGMLFGTLVVLAGCGGGGGGSGGSGPVTGGAGGAPQHPVVRAPNTITTYNVDAASIYIVGQAVSSSRLDPAGSAGTVVLQTDSNGNVSGTNFFLQAAGFNENRFQVQAQSAGINFNRSYSDIVSFPTLALSQLAGQLQQVNPSDFNPNFAFIGEAPNLSYSAYGVWAADPSYRLGAFAFGTTTPISAMPLAGTATYQGATMGAGMDASGPYALRGIIQVNVDFGTRAVATNITGIQTQNLGTNAVSSGSNLAGSGTISGNRFTTTLAGGASSGGLHGTFYGPSAEEVAGAWRVTGGGNTAIGSFGAKR